MREPTEQQERASMWRNGVGVAVEALDRYRAHVAKTRRMSPTVKAFDEGFNRILQIVADESRRSSPANYREANDASKAVNVKVAEAIAAEGGPPIPLSTGYTAEHYAALIAAAPELYEALAEAGGYIVEIETPASEDC